MEVTKENIFNGIDTIKAPARIEPIEPEFTKIEVPTNMIPKSGKLVEAYLTEKEVIICGFPDEDDETHNCDQMGCSTLSHVMHRFNLDDSYERKFSGD